MKAYKIRHAPSGKFYCKYFGLTESNGTIFDFEPIVKHYLVLARVKYHKEFHPSEFEIAEYDLVEITN